MKNLTTFDIEIYPNYFLCAFRSAKTGKLKSWSRINNEKVDFSDMFDFMDNRTLVSFNGINFDMVLLAALRKGASNAKLKEICDYIILTGKPAYQVLKYFKLQPLFYDHIDISNVAKGMAGLKQYGARIHSKSIQELPYSPDKSLTEDQAEQVKSYCENDLKLTQDLFDKLKDQIQLRVDMSDMYGIDLRSKSDAQIAEAVFRSEFKQRNIEFSLKHDIQKELFYTAPSYIKFKSDELNQLLVDIQKQAIVLGKSDKYKSPPCFLSDRKLKSGRVKKEKRVITLGTVQVTLALGGLHSLETNVHIESGKQRIIDRDVASYYPRMILNNNWYPETLGQAFIKLYEKIVNDRLAAKKAKDTITAEALKIVINGSYGKLGNHYSCLYTPRLMMQTTITGQLSLLMFIEMLTLNGHSVLSANTDGVVTLVEDYDNFIKVVKQWEQITNFETEETEYSTYFARDVNNYLAITTGGKLKRKGVFADYALDKNPMYKVVYDAVLFYLLFGIDVSCYIRNCRNVEDFMLVTSSTCGAVNKEGERVGKVLRFYYSTIEKNTLFSSGSGATIPRSTDSRLCSAFPESFPNDIDYDRYIAIANGVLNLAIEE